VEYSLPVRFTVFKYLKLQVYTSLQKHWC
jgi:hypothetical protein